MQLAQPVSLEDLARLCGATVVQAPTSHTVTGLNEIHKVVPGDLSFVDHPKYYQKCLHSAATTVLANSEALAADLPAGKALLYHPDPFAAYNALTAHYRPAQPMEAARMQRSREGFMYGQHVSMGAGTRIAPGVVIGNHVSIGRDCLIGPNVVLHDFTTLGDRCVIQAGVVLGSDAFYYKRRPEGYDRLLSCGRTLIGDDVEIGALSVVVRGVSGDTIIGNGCKIDTRVHLAHGVVLGAHCLLASGVAVAGKTVIGDNVTLWGGVLVQKSITIGDGAVVLACSGVSKSLQGGKTYFGIPAVENREKLRELATLRRITGKKE